MPNNYFKFKQFTIHQDKCAMKVCTDACLFGAWVANRFSFTADHLAPTGLNILDIGTGTGLLSLMLAQKHAYAAIDAVEMHEAAAKQAKENFASSAWQQRLEAHHSSIQQFAATTNKKYDVVISNPPFYEGDLKSDDVKRNLALHSAGLTLAELIQAACNLLVDDGSFFVLLPSHRAAQLEQLIQQVFFTREKVFIKQTPAHGYFRNMFWLKKQPGMVTRSEIVIMDENGKYTDEFAALLENYYLYL